MTEVEAIQWLAFTIFGIGMGIILNLAAIAFAILRSKR